MIPLAQPEVAGASKAIANAVLFLILSIIITRCFLKTALIASKQVRSLFLDLTALGIAISGFLVCVIFKVWFDTNRFDTPADICFIFAALLILICVWEGFGVMRTALRRTRHGTE